MIGTPKNSTGLEYIHDVTLSYCLVKGIGSCNDTELVIPAEYNGLPVVGIAKNAFHCCKSIKKIVLCEGLRMICPNAFSACTALTDVYLPNSLVSIGYMAFCGCSSLKSVQIPKSVDMIGGYALANCIRLTSLSYSGTRADWHNICTEYSFDDNTGSYTLYCKDGSLQKLSLRCILLEKLYANAHPETVTHKNRPKSKGLEYTFSEDNGSVYITGIGCCTDAEIYIPDTVDGKPVKRIEKKAFKGCNGITSVSIPFGVEVICSSAFCDCKSLTYINIPDSVQIIENAAFLRCEALIKITVGNSVDRIAPHTFMGCTSLSEVNLPDSIESIGMSAFDGCTSLCELAVPCNVSYIGMNAFSKAGDPIQLKYPKSRDEWLIGINAEDDLLSQTIFTDQYQYNERR